MTKNYGKLASRVYELDKPVGCSFGDVEFYLERLKNVTGPILEPAAGNGRMLVPLAQAGHMVSGFDLSADMLDLCKINCANYGVKADLSRQGFTTFQYPQKFAAIVLPVGSFQLMADPVEAISFLRRCKQALAAGGKLLLDIATIDRFMDDKPRVRRWADGDDLLTLQEMHMATDYVGQIAASQLRYELWRDTQLIATEMELFYVRWWGRYELELALREAGFTQITIFGDYKTGAIDTGLVGTLTFEAQ
ncbi:class I SAM-dependent methyltransferase [Pseudochrobactrum sp. HB0163]|uniref:class I SAM-dependent methyltransferase n=1 Tax=Pseudochrobactrum sp. HB0163 TaxID=3450708 RepID=UPI003F6DD314